MIAELVADGLAIQDRFKAEPLFRETGRGSYDARTVEDIQRGRTSIAG